MATQSYFIIQNDLPGSIILDIEPECVHFSLGRGEKVSVSDKFEKEPVTLRIECDKGDTIISIWPGDGEVRVEKDGVEVFELIQKGVAVSRGGV
jgi:hypothetical protein